MFLKEELKSYPCNMCSEKDFKTISRRDRYGFKVQTVICKRCSLIFIDPRMDKESYNDFYQQTYRPLLEEYKGKKVDHQKNWDNSFKIGLELGQKFLPFFRKGKTLEIGSSTGGVLAGLKKLRADLDIVGIEPSLEESNFACKAGIPTTTGLFENIDTGLFSRFSNKFILFFKIILSMPRWHNLSDLKFN